MYLDDSCTTHSTCCLFRLISKLFYSSELCKAERPLHFKQYPSKLVQIFPQIVCSMLKLLGAPNPPQFSQDQLKGHVSVRTLQCLFSQAFLLKAQINKFEEVETRFLTSTASLFTVYDKNAWFISTCYRNSSQVQSFENQKDLLLLLSNDSILTS